MKTFNPISRIWRRICRLPITIRAALIAGAATILSVVLAFALGFLGNTQAPRPAGQETPAVSAGAPSKEEAIRLVKAYYGYTDFPEDSVQLTWFDFADRGKPNEFYATYEHKNQPIVDVFTVQGGSVENLYHRMGCSEELGAAHAVLGGKTFFLCGAKAGSGAYLDFSAFQYDGIGKPKLAYKGDFFGGSFHALDNRVFLANSSQKFELKYNGGALRAERYRERLSPYEMVAGTHVLAFHFLQKAFSVTYDGQTLAFDLTDANRFSIHTPIAININEQLFVDDNFGDEEDLQIRILSHGWKEGHLVTRHGFFTCLELTKRGTVCVSVNVGYGDWYDIWFSVE